MKAHMQLLAGLLLGVVVNGVTFVSPTTNCSALTSYRKCSIHVNTCKWKNKKCEAKPHVVEDSDDVVSEDCYACADTKGFNACKKLKNKGCQWNKPTKKCVNDPPCKDGSSDGGSNKFDGGDGGIEEAIKKMVEKIVGDAIGDLKKEIPTMIENYMNENDSSDDDDDSSSSSGLPKCKCADVWTVPSRLRLENTCEAEQNGCPNKRCDGFRDAWCIVEESPCEGEELSGETNEPDGWIYCTPEELEPCVCAPAWTSEDDTGCEEEQDGCTMCDEGGDEPWCMIAHSPCIGEAPEWPGDYENTVLTMASDGYGDGWAYCDEEGGIPNGAWRAGQGVWSPAGAPSGCMELGREACKKSKDCMFSGGQCMDKN